MRGRTRTRYWPAHRAALQAAARFRTVTILNGYSKTDQAYSCNGRVKRAAIETSRGFKTTVTVRDTKDEQKFVIPTTTAA